MVWVRADSSLCPWSSVLLARGQAARLLVMGGIIGVGELVLVVTVQLLLGD